MNKIKNEQYINTMQEMWVQENRQELMLSLRKRHEDQINLLKKTGLIQNGNRLTSGMSGKVKSNGSNYNHKNGNVSDIDQIMSRENSRPLTDNEGSIITRKENIPERIRLEDQNMRYASIEKENSGVMGRKRESIDSVIEGHARNLSNARKIYYDTLPEREIKLTNKFKTMRPIQKSANFERLYSLKKNPDASNPFLASDFRGLLITDYNEALNN